MALIDVYNMINKSTATPGRMPTHDFAAIMALYFRDHVNGATALAAINGWVSPNLTTAEINGVNELKTNYDAKLTAIGKAEYLQDVIWVFHLVETGSITATLAGTIVG